MATLVNVSIHDPMCAIRATQVRECRAVWVRVAPRRTALALRTGAEGTARLVDETAEKGVMRARSGDGRCFRSAVGD